MSDPLEYLEPAATRVRDPLTNRSVWLAGMVASPRFEEGALHFVLEFSRGHSRDDRARIVEAVTANLRGKGWEGPVECEVRVEGVRRSERKGALKTGAEARKKDPVPGMSGGGMGSHGGAITKSPVPGVQHIIAVASGKGGVGKSTVATNLAVALARRGHLVGLLDADIYGPSLPTMMGVSGRPVANGQKQILPLHAYGVKCISMGFLADQKQAIIWRGPMVMGVVRQFLHDVAWAPVDYLVVDLPPGTGDAQLTMIQAVPISGSVIVTTPQDVALLDAVRGIEMFRKLDVPVLGVIENMSWLELPNGDRMHPFGQGGGQRLADDYQVDLLGQIALDGDIRAGGDAGDPVALGDSAAAQTFLALADTVRGTLHLQ